MRPVRLVVAAVLPMLLGAAPARQGADPVDPTLVKAFNEAAATHHKGEYAAAAASYRKLLGKLETKKHATIPRFGATVRLQLAYALMDLKDYPAAEIELGKVDTSTFNPPQLYDYYFSLGNTLGAQKKLNPMFSAFSRAISASEEAGDSDRRPQLCWTRALGYALKAEDWKYLLELAEKADQVAGVRGWKEVKEQALVAKTEAKAHLK